jgi:hypothetical protein
LKIYSKYENTLTNILKRTFKIGWNNSV